jgi:hypothetical protein
MLGFIQVSDAQIRTLPRRQVELKEIVREAETPVLPVLEAEVVPGTEGLKRAPRKPVEEDNLDAFAHAALPYVGVTVIATWVGATLDLSQVTELPVTLSIAMAIFLVGSAFVVALAALRPAR